jgi:tetratricopeptide (TPR) repeat protein
LETRTGLGEALCHQGKYADAEREYPSVLKLQEKVMGPEHPNTLLTRSDLAEVFYHQNKYTDAETEFREVLKRWPSSRVSPRHRRLKGITHSRRTGHSLFPRHKRAN